MEPLDNEHLDRRLRDLQAQARYPATPSIAAAASRTLNARERRRRRSRLSSPLLALGLVLVVASAAVGLGLGLRGLNIVVVSAPPTPNIPSDPLHLRQSLGVPGTLSDAIVRLGSALLVPQTLRQPDEIYLGHSPFGGERVALLYRAEPAAPAISGDIGLVVTEWEGQLDDGYATKWIHEDGGTVEEVTVRGLPGYWFSGMPHTFEYLDEVNGMHRPIERLVGDVLVWTEGDTVYRIESSLGRDATLDVAQSMVPAR
jgi:hypothetical protein